MGADRRAGAGHRARRRLAARVPHRLPRSSRAAGVKLLLATYFGQLQDNLYLAANLPVAGLHVDAINGRDDVMPLLDLLPSHKVLSLGVDQRPQHLEDRPQRGARLARAAARPPRRPPVDRAVVLAAARAGRPGQREASSTPSCKSWLAFALQKLDELQVLATALNQGRDVGRATRSAANRAAIDARRALAARAQPRGAGRGRGADAGRSASRQQRLRAARRQAGRAAEPAGLSRPPPSARSRRRAEIRHARSEFKAGELDAAGYQARDAGRDRAQRARAGGAGPGRAGARRGRAQRHGGVLRRAARRLRVQRVRLGAVLRLALREAADPVRRHLAARSR